MLKRIWCFFRGHRPRRHKGTAGQYSLWTDCGHCRQLMVRGYYGWQRATRAEVVAFKRDLARRKAKAALANQSNIEQADDSQIKE